MNKKEYYARGYGKHGNKWWRYTRKLLEEWKAQNNIHANMEYVVHHRNDTEECRKYNNERYEFWGAARLMKMVISNLNLGNMYNL